MTDPLTDAALSTSLYEFEGVRGAATLEEAGFPTCIEFDQQGPSAALHPRYIQLQIVKRDKTLTLLVDGHRVSPSPNADSTTPVELRNHTGIHRDPLSDSLIFSPCVVSVFCEDGQRTTTTCTISIEQTTRAQLDVVGDTTHLGSVDVPVARVQDVVAPVVVTPFPLQLSRQPRVTILDMSAVQRYDLRRLDTTVWSAGILFKDVFMTLIISSDGGAATVDTEGRNFLGNLRSYVASLFATEPDKAEQNYITFWQTLRNSIPLVLVPGLLAVVFMASGYTIGAGTLLGIGQSVAAGNAAQATLKSIFIGSALSTIKDVFKSPPRPKPAHISFSLKELADTLYTLAAASTKPREEEEEGVDSKQNFRREMLVWTWLLESNTNQKKNTTVYASNLMNFKEFDNAESPTSSVGLLLRIFATDPEVCGDPIAWEVTSGREDNVLLGLAAGGFLDALAQLQSSIMTFARAIDNAIDARLDSNRPYDEQWA